MLYNRRNGSPGQDPVLPRCWRAEFSSGKKPRSGFELASFNDGVDEPTRNFRRASARLDTTLLPGQHGGLLFMDWAGFGCASLAAGLDREQCGQRFPEAALAPGNWLHSWPYQRTRTARS